MDIKTSAISQGLTKQAQDAASTATSPTRAEKKPENTASVKPASKEVITASEIEKAIEKTNNVLSQRSTGLEFSLDADSGKTIVKLIDKETKEILRQYPTEEMISISKAIDKFQGALVSEKV